MHSWWIVTGKHCTTAECALWSPPTAHTHHPPTHPPTHPHTHSHTPPHTHSLLPSTPPPHPPPTHTHTHMHTLPLHHTPHPVHCTPTPCCHLPTHTYTPPPPPTYIVETRLSLFFRAEHNAIHAVFPHAAVLFWCASYYHTPGIGSYTILLLVYFM
jgi:hypothetical protein